MTYEKLWTGGFLGYSSVRHGFMDGVRVVGREASLPDEAKSIRQFLPELANAKIEYQGYFVHQDNILFCYLAGEYRSGVHKVHLNPRDGQLYLSGMNGWGSYTSDAGCFQRLRYTGKKIQLPIGFHVHSNRVAIRFQRPISSEQAGNALSHFAQCWNYRYSPGYGSKEYSVLHSPMIGHDCLSISAAHVLDQGQTLFLEMPDLQICSQLHLRVQVDKGAEPQELFATVNAMDGDRVDIPNYKVRTGKVVFAHPMLRDLEWLKRSVPNPWQKKIGGARHVRIESRDNLQFSTRTMEATAGEIIKLTFGNPDVVPHN